MFSISFLRHTQALSSIHEHFQDSYLKRIFISSILRLVYSILQVPSLYCGNHQPNQLDLALNASIPFFQRVFPELTGLCFPARSKHSVVSFKHSAASFKHSAVSFSPTVSFPSSSLASHKRYISSQSYFRFHCGS